MNKISSVQTNANQDSKSFECGMNQCVKYAEDDSVCVCVWQLHPLCVYLFKIMPGKVCIEVNVVKNYTTVCVRVFLSFENKQKTDDAVFSIFEYSMIEHIHSADRQCHKKFGHFFSKEEDRFVCQVRKWAAKRDL